MVSDLTRMIDQVSREKGVDRDVLIKALEEAVKTAARKKYGQEYDMEANYNDELGEIEVFEFKEVVENVTSEELQISLEDAHKIDAESELGDELGIKMETEKFGRIAAQSAKQVIMHRLKDAERDIVYDDFKDRRGEIINGIVNRFDRGSIIANLGRTEAELPPKEQVPREAYKQGDRIRAYILNVRQFSRGPQIVLSRTHPNFVSGLFENEVPEISEGIVEVMQVAREPGGRTKIAVVSKDSDVDPVGACVGMKGSRVQAVVQELRGEKIDIVTWDSDPAKFICNALSPAEIVRVIVDENNRSMEVVVPDDQLSLAIGKRGQNVRLASRLTGWKLDVTSETNYNQTLKEGYKSLLELQGVGPKRASDLYDEGFMSASDVAKSTVQDLNSVEGMTEKRAAKLIEDAVSYTNGETVVIKAEEDSTTEDSQDQENEKAVSEEVSDVIKAEEDSTTEDSQDQENEKAVSEEVSDVIKAKEDSTTENSQDQDNEKAVSEEVSDGEE